MKQKIALAIGVMIFAGSLIGGMRNVSANNYKDTTFYFSYYADGTDTTIAPRVKLDKTATYMKNDGCSTKVAAFVAGTNRANEANGITPNRCSEIYEMQPGTYKYMSNTVYGKYKYAYLVVGADDKRNHIICGKWSPDNISGRY